MLTLLGRIMFGAGIFSFQVDGLSFTASVGAKDWIFPLRFEGTQEQQPHCLSIGAIKAKGKKEGQLGRNLEGKGSGSGQANFRRHRRESENLVLAWTISPLSFPRSGTVKLKCFRNWDQLKASFGRWRHCVLQHSYFREEKEKRRKRTRYQTVETASIDCQGKKTSSAWTSYPGNSYLHEKQHFSPRAF